MIIAITNQKGGVGKTTTATALASGLALQGYKVLMVDTDPQCNCTDTYRAEIEGKATLYDLMLEDEPAENCVQETPHGFIIAGDPLLKDADKQLSGVDGAFRLRERLEPLKEKYDFIILDTKPTMSILLTNALTAADRVIIPVTADRYGIQGLTQLNETIASIKKYTNPGLVIDGLLLVKHNGRTKLAKELTAALEQFATQFDTVVYKTTIRESVKTKEAQTVRQSLFKYAPYCSTALDYDAFIKVEFLKGK